MKAEDANNFCGRCHRTWEEIVLQGVVGINTIRFQPYRLTNSRCFDGDDQRIACMACHDPHKAPDREPSAYDPKCLACHGPGSQRTKGPGCRVANKDCVTCHMPKYELPGAHHKFTDHLIRVVREGEPFPG
jgi:hypothetical protein